MVALLLISVFWILAHYRFGYGIGTDLVEDAVDI